MVVGHASMHKVGPHTWTFSAPAAVAPMKAHCRSCHRSVAILNPVPVDLRTGNYVVRGNCNACGAEVVLIVS